MRRILIAWILIPWLIILSLGAWVAEGLPGLSLFNRLVPDTDLNRSVAEAVRNAREAASKARDVRAQALRMADTAKQASERAKDAMARAKRGEPGYGVLCESMFPDLCFEYKYYGQVVNGKREGYGIFGCYRGLWHNDQQVLGVTSGSCVIRATDGIGDPDAPIHYAGQWADGQESGLGVIAETAYGYSGEYKGGDENGYGVRYNRSPDSYDIEEEGQFVKRDVEGFAVRVTTGTVRRREEGHFVGNVLNGFGAKFDLDGHLVEQGVYEGGYLRSALK
jgi:hypothetical protein